MSLVEVFKGVYNKSGKVYSNSTSTKPTTNWKHSEKCNCTLGLLSKNSFETNFDNQGKEKIKGDLGRILYYSTQNVHVAKTFHESSFVDSRLGTDI